MPKRRAIETTSRMDDALRLIDEWIGPQGVNGAAAVVWRGGEIAAERYAGEARPGVPVNEGTIFALASVTKPVTAAVVMSLVDEGRVALDESIYRFVPEFAAVSDAANVDPDLEARRREVTIRQLLAHTSGLPEALPPGTLPYRDRHDLATMIVAICLVPLRTAPGADPR